MTLDQYPADFWIVHRPFLLDLPCTPAEILSLSRIETMLETVPEECDLLLFRTGAERWRDAASDVYAREGPGVASDVARWLRTHRRLKFLGMDFISVSSFQHREEGHSAHRVFLSTYEGESQPILLIEDMALGALNEVPSTVVIAPLLFDGAEGAPVTVLAQFERRGP